MGGWVGYLVTSEEVFPLGLALFRASIITLVPHPGGDNFPKQLVPLGLHETPIQLRSDHEELLRFLNTPLRESIGIDANTAGSHQKDLLNLKRDCLKERKDGKRKSMDLYGDGVNNKCEPLKKEMEILKK
ncbi:hypothetical protein V6N12_049874 [Hibiscus sabdariffa]|uniref:Uncharacterized protein n=1 Tax=Hibiscus sabdariffa TaxID=183260 RepID=A0ABR2GAS5_9ROSI